MPRHPGSVDNPTPVKKKSAVVAEKNRKTKIQVAALKSQLKSQYIKKLTACSTSAMRKQKLVCVNTMSEPKETKVEDEPLEDDVFNELVETKGEDTPSESSPAIKSEEDEPASGTEDDAKSKDTESKEKPPPFHEHPRWKQKEAETEELRKQNEELRTDFDAFKEDASKKPSDTSDPIPQWFVDQYGENDQNWRAYQQREQTSREQFKQEILGEVQANQSKAQADFDKANQLINKQVTDLQVTSGVDFTTLDEKGQNSERNELMAVMNKFKPVNDQGNWDFEKGYEILQMSKGKPDKEKSDARKKIAASTTTKETGEPKSKDYVNQQDLKSEDWSSIGLS